MNHSHARSLLRAFLPVLAMLPLSLAAAEPTEAQLARLLKRYPAADTSRDGILSAEEAKIYRAKLLGGETEPTPKVPKAADGAKRAAEPAPTPTHANVKYGPHERNVLDLWLAKSDHPTALVVFIHGGGFMNNGKESAPAQMIRDTLAAGVSFMSINYRYRKDAAIQDILRDCARSIQFVRAQAKDYNLDPVRIASFGGSAGAGSTLWLAFHEDLADPKNADPILRESSRIAAGATINTQATYDVTKWESFLGQPDPAWSSAMIDPTFYHFKDVADLKTEAGLRVLADTDMLGLITKDDPPVFLYNGFPGGPATNRAHYVHHPDHTRAVKQRCDTIGVPAAVFYAKAEPKTEGDYRQPLLDFLVSHLQPHASGE